MGGSSKPADPKVTPYQEPAAPTNPIPNFFGGQSGGGYKPNTGASEQAFTMPAQPTAQSFQQPAPQPMQQPMQGMGQANYGQQPENDGRMGFSIPTRQQGFGGIAQNPYGGPRNAGNNPFMAGGGFGGMFGNPFGGDDMRANMERIMADPNGFQDRILGMFRNGIGGLQNAPRLQNLMPSWAQQAQQQSQDPAPELYGVRPGTDRRA